MTRFRENPKWVHFSGFWIIGKGSITRERDFSRTCGFRRNLANLMFFLFKQKKVHINGLDFRQNAKNLVFQHKCCKISILRFFFENRAPSLFVVYGPLTSCKKSEKSYGPIPRKIPNGRRGEERRDNCSSIGHIAPKESVWPKNDHFYYNMRFPI